MRGKQRCSYRDVIKSENLKICRFFLTVVRALVIPAHTILIFYATVLVLAGSIPEHGDLVMKCSTTLVISANKF